MDCLNLLQNSSQFFQKTTRGLGLKICMISRDLFEICEKVALRCSKTVFRPFKSSLHCKERQGAISFPNTRPPGSNIRFAVVSLHYEWFGKNRNLCLELLLPFFRDLGFPRGDGVFPCGRRAGKPGPVFLIEGLRCLYTKIG